MIEQEGGTLLAIGVNNRGQCGVGSITNNIWMPQPGRGLTINKNSRNSDNNNSFFKEQVQPIVQVALGFQYGYALSKEPKEGHWGKVRKGQMGR
jgi:hypothetical protein